jgi:peptidoglycan/xylan/chitin deacetylase (PgdA/CDA1 family)
MESNTSLWPGQKRVAFIVSIMLETWSEGVAPPYSVQATAVKNGATDHGGIAWGEYGGKIGVWRILRVLDEFNMKGTFCPNARAAELYPEAVRQVAQSGHTLGAHGIYQNQLLTYLDVDGQRAAIRNSIETLERIAGVRPEGWASPVLAWTPHTLEMLVKEGLLWYGDPTYIDVPQDMHTPAGSIVGIPASDFSDNRVLRGTPGTYFDVYQQTFEHLRQTEPMSVLHATLHCHWGGRPLMLAVFRRLLRYLKESNDVWFTSHSELARFVRKRAQPIRSLDPHVGTKSRSRVSG